MFVFTTTTATTTPPSTLALTSHHSLSPGNSSLLQLVPFFFFIGCLLIAQDTSRTRPPRTHGTAHHRTVCRCRAIPFLLLRDRRSSGHVGLPACVLIDALTPFFLIQRRTQQRGAAVALPRGGRHGSPRTFQLPLVLCSRSRHGRFSALHLHR